MKKINLFIVAMVSGVIIIGLSALSFNSVGACRTPNTPTPTVDPTETTVSTVTPTNTPTETAIPTETPTGVPTEILTPTVTQEVPMATPTSEGKCVWKQYILRDEEGHICYIQRNFERGDRSGVLPGLYRNTEFMRTICSQTCTGKALPWDFGQLDSFWTTCDTCDPVCK